MAFIETPPEGLEGWREVWREDLRYRQEPSQSFLHRITRSILTPLIRRVTRADQERQRNFNVAALELITDLRRDIADLRGELEHLQGQLPVGVRRNDALVAALDQKIETVAARVRDLTLPALEGPEAPGFRGNVVYRGIEDGLRGSEFETRESMQDYAARADAHQPVLEMGCGRGEFLDLCVEHRITAQGIDSNERSVASLRARGLDAVLGMIPADLRSMEDQSYGSILAAHVVEHLQSDDLIALFAEARRLLRGGGLFMIETPNAQSIAMASTDFWRDPTHVAPRPAAVLTVLGRQFGFEVEEMRTLSPYPAANLLRIEPGSSPQIQRVVERLNELLFGDQNLRLVLRKAG
jgi:O-antigen chain-terminating methyltransferase